MTEMADGFLISTTKNTTSIRQMFKKKKTINEIRDDAEMRGIYHKGTTTIKYTFTLRAQGEPVCEAAGCLLLRDTKLTKYFQEDLPSDHRCCRWPTCKANEMC